MQPIRHTKTARLRSLKMYRTELDQLVKFFEDRCAKVEISDNDHRYESLDEMKKHVGPRIKALDIRGENPSVHFLLNQKELLPGPPGAPPTASFYNELRTEEITDDAEALFLKIKEFLSSYQRQSTTWLLLIALVFVGASIFSFSFLGTPAYREYRTVLTVVLLSSLTFAILLLSLATTLSRNYLMLETRLSSPSFLKRKRDDLILGILIALFGAVLGIIGTLVTQHFTK
jgi:hypothetical protein